MAQDSVSESSTDSGKEMGPSSTGLARRPSRSNTIKLVIILFFVIIALLWIGQWLYHQHTHVSGDDARVMTDEITVSSRLAGRVVGFSLIEGDLLTRGDVIATLYSRPDQLRLDALKAKVAGMKATIAFEKQQIELSTKHLKGGIQETQDELDADKSTLQAAKAVMDSTEKTYNRSRDLVKTGAVTAEKRDLDYYNYLSALADYDRAKRQIAVDHTALANARTGLMSSPQMVLPTPKLLRAQMQVTRQALAEAQADLQHQQLRLNDMTVRSPLDGVIDKGFVNQGEYVSPGQPILMMHAPEDVWVEAKIKETSIGNLKVGQSVAIHVDADPSTTYKGHIVVIGHAATSQFALLPDPNPSGNFTKISQRIPVRIVIDKGPKAKLSPGMMVEVDIDISGDGH